MNVVLLSSDLLFTSHLTHAANASGCHLTAVRDLDPFLEAAARPDVRLVLLDLTAPNGDPKAIMDHLQSLPGIRPTVIAYGPHVHNFRLAEARDAGCDRVLSRGQLHRDIGQLLAEYFC